MNNYRDVPANSATEGAKIYSGYLSDRATRSLGSRRTMKVRGRLTGFREFTRRLQRIVAIWRTILDEITMTKNLSAWEILIIASRTSLIISLRKKQRSISREFQYPAYVEENVCINFLTDILSVLLPEINYREAKYQKKQTVELSRAGPLELSIGLTANDRRLEFNDSIINCTWRPRHE